MQKTRHRSNIIHRDDDYEFIESELLRNPDNSVCYIAELYNFSDEYDNLELGYYCHETLKLSDGTIKHRICHFYNYFKIIFDEKYTPDNLMDDVLFNKSLSCKIVNSNIDYGEDGDNLYEYDCPCGYQQYKCKHDIHVYKKVCLTCGITIEDSLKYPDTIPDLYNFIFGRTYHSIILKPYIPKHKLKSMIRQLKTNINNNTNKEQSKDILQKIEYYINKI